MLPYEEKYICTFSVLREGEPLPYKEPHACYMSVGRGLGPAVKFRTNKTAGDKPPPYKTALDLYENIYFNRRGDHWSPVCGSI